MVFNKSRLVVHGNHQHKTIFFETLVDAASHRRIHVLSSIAASESLIMFSIVIKMAHLYSLINEILYLQCPQALDSSIMPPIVKFDKWLYSLNQETFELRLLLDTILKTNVLFNLINAYVIDKSMHNIDIMKR